MKMNIITRFSRINGLKRTIESIHKQDMEDKITHYITYENEIPELKNVDFVKNTIFVKVSKIPIIKELYLQYHHHDYHTDYVNFDLNKNCFYSYKEPLKIEPIKYPVVKFEDVGLFCTTLDRSIVPFCEHFPCNIYFNTVHDLIDDGWIFYLDDGDVFEYDDSLKCLIDEVNNNDEDTLHIFKLINRGRGWTTPKEKWWNNYLKLGHPLIYGECSGSCLCFHSKWKGYTKWDEFRYSDYRTARSLETVIPKRNLFDKIIIWTP